MSNLQQEVQTYDDLTHKQWIALGTKCGGLQNVIDVLQGVKDITLIDVIIRLFDKNGRCIPPKDSKFAICDPDRNFHLVKPTIDYKERLERLMYAYQLTQQPVSVAEYEDKASQLLELLRADAQTVNTLVGVYLPTIVLPNPFADLGRRLSEFDLPAVERAYLKQYSERKFVNYRKGDLEGKVTIVEGSRHERVIERLKQGPLVAIHLPNPLQGFSVLAQREQMTTLSKHFSLAGGADTCSSVATYPDVTVGAFKTPGYDLSALQWRRSEDSLVLGADDDELRFGSRSDLGFAYVRFSGGLLFW